MEKKLDVYQTRYLAHQKRKMGVLRGEIQDYHFTEYGQEDLESLVSIISNRRSRRVFSKNISDDEFNIILKIARLAPSSCNRKAIKIINSKNGIDSLVGGKGWVEKADKVLLLYGDMEAYKSPNEKSFMPYLDAGFIAQNVYLICEVLNIKCCFINPNHIGEEIEKDGFTFCGAIAIGK